MMVMKEPWLLPDVENKEGRRPTQTPEAQFKGSCATEASMSWTQYHGYNTHVRYMECLASKYPGQVGIGQSEVSFDHTINQSQVKLHTIGRSTEGRSLKLVEIGNSYSSSQSIWIDCGIHAREWISPATCAYIMRELVENSNQYSDILDRFDVYIMPSVNPDGEKK